MEPEPADELAQERLSDESVRDELPDDLDARGVGLVGPYVFPDNDRRRIPGLLYLVLATATVVVVVLVDGSPLVDSGLVAGAVGLALVGAYHLQAGWSLEVDEADALVAAVRAAYHALVPVVDCRRSGAQVRRRDQVPGCHAQRRSGAMSWRRRGA